MMRLMESKQDLVKDDGPSMEAVEPQLDELELLQSVFSQPGEFSADRAVIETSAAWTRGLTTETPVSRLSCRLHLSVDRHPAAGEDSDEEGEDGSRDGSAEAACRGTEQCTLDISMTLPHRYPDERPEVYVSSDSLTRRGQDDLNADLKQFKMTLPLGEVCLLTIAEWVKDNAGSYFPIVSPQPNTSKSAGRGGRTFCRLWLYMHHIYSKTKRRNILDLADQLQLSGFCLPGKPGVVCVEGDEGSTRDFFNVLRRWNWKSISCRHREEEVTTECGDLSSHRRVEGFGELGLATHGPRGDHMDMGQFRTYLEKHSLGHVFPILFGVEGQTS